jgi:hypothetical protein
MRKGRVVADDWLLRARTRGRRSAKCPFPRVSARNRTLRLRYYRCCISEEPPAMVRVIAALATLILLSTLLLPAVAQERSKGISVHMLPKRVADLGGAPWGFSVSMVGTKRVASPPVIQTATDLLAFCRGQEPSVQENGIWIVVTDPDAFSQPEKDLLESESRCSSVARYGCLTAGYGMTDDSLSL